MALVPVMFLAQSRKFRGFYRRNKRPLMNLATGVLTFGLALEVFGKQKRMKALEARTAEAEAALRELQGVVSSEKWARRTADAMGAPDGSFVELLKQVRPHVKELSKNAALDVSMGKEGTVSSGRASTTPVLPPVPPELLVQQTPPPVAPAQSVPSTNTMSAAVAARFQSRTPSTEQGQGAAGTTASAEPSLSPEEIAALPLHKRPGFM